VNRSWEELYADIARLPLPERQRLLARLLLDLAAEVEVAGDQRPTPGDLAPTVVEGHGPVTEPHPSPQESPRPVTSSPRHLLTPKGTAHARLIVDGSNFLGTVPGFDLASAQSRETLILRLQEFARRHLTTQVVVFFDGKKASATTRSGVEIRFSPAAKTADQQILAFLRNVPKEERGEALLVTEDAELSQRAQAMGVHVERPLRFRRRIPDPPRPPADRGLSPAEVAEWEEYFRRGGNR
jgi:hypothetical protein